MLEAKFPCGKSTIIKENKTRSSVKRYIQFDMFAIINLNVSAIRSIIGQGQRFTKRKSILDATIKENFSYREIVSDRVFGRSFLAQSVNF